MVVAVMGSAQRYGELVADLEPHRAGLGEPQMVGVGGASSADQTGLRGNELEVGEDDRATISTLAANRSDWSIAVRTWLDAVQAEY
jgi:hypothetical protein